MSRYIFDWSKTYGRCWSDFGLILAGDLNALPGQSVMGMIFDMEYTLPEEPNQPCALARHQYVQIGQAYEKLKKAGKLLPISNKLVSAYQDYFLSGRNMLERHPYTIYGSMFKGTIDYILYNPGALKLVSILAMPDEAIMRAQNFLPSRLFPSDHLRIEAIFEFRRRFG